jgi:hypothetical protein
VGSIRVCGVATATPSGVRSAAFGRRARDVVGPRRITPAAGEGGAGVARLAWVLRNGEVSRRWVPGPGGVGAARNHCKAFCRLREGGTVLGFEACPMFGSAMNCSSETL